MGREAVARELRRETKRTLRRHLETFAENQHHRLNDVCDKVDELRTELSNTRKELKDVKEQSQRTFLVWQLFVSDTETFLGRVRWLFRGRRAGWKS